MNLLHPKGMEPSLRRDPGRAHHWVGVRGGRLGHRQLLGLAFKERNENDHVLLIRASLYNVRFAFHSNRSNASIDRGELTH